MIWLASLFSDLVFVSFSDVRNGSRFKVRAPLTAVKQRKLRALLTTRGQRIANLYCPITMSVAVAALLLP